MRCTVALAVTVAMLAQASATRARAEGAERDDEKVPAARQSAEAKPLAIVGGDVYPVVSAPLPGGTVLLRGGRIQALLPAGRGKVPRGYEVIDATGRRVYPGFVAASMTDMGLFPDVWSGNAREVVARFLADSFDAWSDDVELAASAGITSACVLHSATVGTDALDGRGAVLKMSCREPRGIVVKDPAVVHASRALLTPDGRRQLRRAIDDAREWKRKLESDGKPNPYHELMLDVAAGDVPLLVAADGAGEVLTTLEIARELDVRVILQQPTEAWTVADDVADAGVAVMQHVRMSWGKTRGERRASLPGGWRFDAPARLVRAGVPTAIVTFDDDIRLWGVAGRDLLNLPLEAAFAQRGGLTAQQSLEAITIVPARMLGVDDRVGSLEIGKDADVIITDGDPLDYRTFVRTTIVNGKVVYTAEGNRFWSWAIEKRDQRMREP